MKYSIFKNTPRDGDRVQLYDIFQLDSFGRDLVLKPEQINTILDRFKWDTMPNATVLMEHLISYLFENMGGNDETPTNEVMAFMYVLLNSPAFKMTEFMESLKKAVHIDNICRYIQENELMPPEEYMALLKLNVNCDLVFEVIRVRHSFKMRVGMPQEEIDAFVTKVTEEIEAYLDGAKSIEDNYTDLLNNNN